MKKAPGKIAAKEALKRIRKPVPRPTLKHKGKRDVVGRKRLKRELYDILKKGEFQPAGAEVRHPWSAKEA